MQNNNKNPFTNTGLEVSKGFLLIFIFSHLFTRKSLPFLFTYLALSSLLQKSCL